MFNLNLNFLKSIKSFIFPFYRNKDLKFIFKKLQEGIPEDKVAARFVGGCVRRHLSNEKIDDIDVATILATDQIKEKFKDTNLKVIDTGVKHGTVTIVSENRKVELTTLRKDIKTDGRHAEVEYTDSWQQDSERRDFTINAIYMDINGKLYDPQMGTVDLKNKNIKFIGDPQKRIEEDYLRIVRFIRFKVMYDIIVEPTTSDAIKQNLDGIQKISKERILIELLKILSLENFLTINQSSNLREIFSMIFPEFLYLNRLERLKKVYQYSKVNVDILLAVMLIDDKENHEYFIHKYNVSNKTKETLEQFYKNLIKLKNDKEFFEKNLIKNVYLNGKNHLIALNLINFSINSKVKINDFTKTFNKILKIKVPIFPIDGEILKQKGMQEGQSLGNVLKTLEKEWINNNFKISNEKVEEIIKVNSN
ncbi:CCA tRNA nucleotidyltransferase [Candidatus Pelagibacter communis]|uniref:CCA tRNA nucleotidyltransferase n=1 Tax=Pelagibacter ubique TaxID=198252 RepID=UPI00094CD0E6|nr:CCA tRNA nucleotidyltransferase [Candidatus Pelagibacter ubique]